MRGLDGVYSDTKLLRRVPFGEWVTVYFDPKKHTEEQLLARIRATRCPRAQHVTAPGIRTPFVAAGDVVQLETTSTITRIEAPDGWKPVVGTANIQLPKDAKSTTLTAHLADGKTLTAKVNVVSRIGS